MMSVKMYHNGEYLQGGGGIVASDVPSLFVQLDPTNMVSRDNPIIIPNDIMNEQDYTKPFKLYLRGTSSASTEQYLKLIAAYSSNKTDPFGEPNFYFKIGDSVILPKIQAVAPSYRYIPDPLYNSSTSWDNPTNCAQKGLSRMLILEPNTCYEFMAIGSKSSTMELTLSSRDIYSENVVVGSTWSSSRAERTIFELSGGINGRPISFILSTSNYRYTGDNFVPGSGQSFTVGTIHISKSIEISQMPIIGNATIRKIAMLDWDDSSVELPISDDYGKYMADVPIRLAFYFNNVSDYVQLTLFR